MVGPSLIGSGRGLFISILVRDLTFTETEKHLIHKIEHMLFLIPTAILSCSVKLKRNTFLKNLRMT